VREYPAVDPPVITVTTTYRGANPEIVDSQITEPLEQAINGIAGIRTIASTSREGSQPDPRRVHPRFSDLEAAANDVRDKVSQRGPPPAGRRRPAHRREGRRRLRPHHLPRRAKRPARASSK
jgi:multidrug efflux pump subunit AcrB